jgi:hypothetical protein
LFLSDKKAEQAQNGQANDAQQVESSTPKNFSSNHARRGYTVQSKYVKNHEHVYVVINTVPLHRSHNASSSSANDDAPFSRLTFADSIQRSLDEMHGVMGSSFERDLILFRHSSDSTVLAIFKVASEYAQLLTSVISAGVQIKSNAGTIFITRYAGLLNSFDLNAVQAMILPDQSTGQRSLQPPGRAWLQAQFS